MPQIKLYDKKGKPLPFINIRLAINGQSEEDAYDERFIDFAGNTAWPNPLPSPSGYDLYVNYRNVNEKYVNKLVHVSNLNDDVIINLDGSPLEKLVIKDKRLYTKSDASYFIKGESAFLDYYRFLRGENIRPLLEQSETLGGNCRRNFMMTFNTAKAAGLPPFNPEDFGDDFYNKFPDFMTLYAEYEQYGYFSIFPDNGLFPSWKDKTGKQLVHWNKLGAIAAKIDNVFGFELTNEFQAKSDNNVDRNAFSKITNLLCCSGSYGESPEGNRYPEPYFDFGDYHSPRHYPNSVKDCNAANNPNRLAGEATLVGEPLGFGDRSLDSRREDDPNIAREMAGSGIGTLIGIFYHCTHGGFSQLYDNVELNCGDAWFEMLEMV